MSHLALVMPTVDRRRMDSQNYLRATLENLRRSGMLKSRRLHSVHLVDSGGAPGWPESELEGHDWVDLATHATDSPDPYLVRVHRAPVGTTRTANMNAAATMRTGAASGAPWVLFLEDDVDVCADFVGSVARWLDDNADEEVRLHTFASTWPGVQLAARKGEAVVPMHAPTCFYGTVCLALRAEDALSVADWLERNPYYKGTQRSYDLLLPRWLGEAHPTRMTMSASAPSFVQHLGDESAVSPGRKKVFEFPSWPGRDWMYMRRELAGA